MTCAGRLTLSVNHQVQQGSGDLACRQHVSRGIILEGIFRHGSETGFARILHNGDTAMTRDDGQARRAIIEQAAEQDGNHPRAISPGDAAEQGVNGRTMAVFARTCGQPDALVVQQQVAVRRRQVNAGFTYALTVHGIGYRQRTHTVEYIGKKARPFRRGVDSH
jgi:hypothetical protein